MTRLETPLNEHDEKIKFADAMHGRVDKWSFEQIEDLCDILKLPKTWKERKRHLAWWHHKPFCLGKFHRHNARKYRFKLEDGNKKKLLKLKREEKFVFKIMVFELQLYYFTDCYFQ